MPNFRSEPQNHVLHSRTNQESQASAVGSNPSAIMRTSGESLATISSTNAVGLPSVRLASGAGLEPTSPTCAGALTVKLPWIRLSLAWGMAVLDMCRFSTHPGALPMCRFSTHTECVDFRHGILFFATASAGPINEEFAIPFFKV